MKKLLLVLDEELYKQICKYAGNNGLTRSAAIRKILSEYITNAVKNKTDDTKWIDMMLGRWPGDETFEEIQAILSDKKGCI